MTETIEQATPAAPDARPDWWGLAPADKVRHYVEGVVGGAIPANKLQRLGVDRHLRDLREGAARGLWFDDRAAALRIQFLEQFCRHSKGELGRRREKIVLSPWQAFIVWCVYGWKKGELRRFRNAYEEVPRKNGKSTLGAGLILIGLVADNEPGAECYVAATKRDQAKIVFGEARRMVQASPELRAKVQCLRDNLSVAGTNSKAEPLGADADTLDGLNPSTYLIDEIHAHKNREVVEKLDTGTGAREQPLGWVITTAGDDPESAWGQMRDYAEKVLTGVFEDDTFFAYIACADPDDDPWDEYTHRKANPNYGISVKPDDLARKAAKARNVPSERNAFFRYHLNIPTQSESPLIPIEDWNKCGGPVDAEAMAGRECYGALDLSRTADTTSYTLLFPPVGADEPWKVLRWSWLPAVARAQQLPGVVHWIDQGLIRGTDGPTTDYQEVRKVILATREKYDLRQVPYDRWNAHEFAQQLYETDGVPMVEFVQNIKNFNEPTKALIELVKDGKLAHGGDPVLRWMASNATAKQDLNENIRPVKPDKNSKKRIDAIVCLIMALALAKVAIAERSVYADRGIRSF